MPGPDWFYLASLLVPAALFDLTMSWLRVGSQYAAPTGWSALAQLRSDLLAHAGFALLWVVGFTVLRTGWRRILLLVACQLSVATYLVFAVAAHSYYRKSGSVLDAGGLKMMLESPTVTRDLAASETSSAHLWLLTAVAAYAIGGPALIYLLRYRGRANSGRFLPGVGVLASPGQQRSARPRRLAFLAGATAAVLVAASAVPTFSGAGAFSRNRAIDVALELGSGLLESERASAERPALAPARLTRIGGSAARPKNVVLITMESLRWEATSLDDPGRDTTPFLAELAERSIVAENAYTVVPHTSKAVTATNCGYVPPLDTKLTESEPAGLPSACLPALLGAHGYRSAFFQSAVGQFERRPDLIKNLGYDSFHPVDDLPTAGFGRANYFGWEDDIMLEPSRDWLRSAGSEPFLLTYLTVTGHHDYRLPTTFPAEKLAEDEELDNYLNAARYVDRFVSKVFDLLAEEGHADDTMVVVIADHGEGFGEHGLRQHDNTIYNEGIKVPYLVYDPTDQRPRTVRRPVSTMSVPETIAETLGYRMADGLVREPALWDKTGGGPVRSSCQSDNRCLAVIDGSTKYVHHFGNRPDEVFDLASDPGERHNLISDADPARLRELRSDLLHWRSEVRAEYAAHHQR
ncbi:MAG: sulfatase-like hydrolase/transferase [Microlunatus sp.]|nr:sulfatase-like hydrolase/transferase [Microlunatus sp.]